MAKMGFRRLQSNRVIAPIIHAAIYERWPEERLRRELHDAYPFGERAHYPYKVWLSCQRDALHVHRVAMGVGPSEQLGMGPLFAGKKES